MARIVLGLGTSHSPQLNTPPDLWPLHAERDRANPGVVASGGLSHFVIDEELDWRVLEGLKAKDARSLVTLPFEKLNSGNSEIRNWLAAAGALERLEMRLIDYVPCYRSEAGTGCAMAFATWT